MITRRGRRNWFDRIARCFWLMLLLLSASWCEFKIRRCLLRRLLLARAAFTNRPQVFQCWNSIQKWNSFWDLESNQDAFVVCMLTFVFAIRLSSFSIIIIIIVLQRVYCYWPRLQKPNNPQFLCTKPFASPSAADYNLRLLESDS